MKRYVSKMIVGVAALAIAGSASAQTITIRITGSTAYRGQTHTAIGHILNAGYAFGYSGSSGLSKASQAEFQGTTIVGNIPVDIKTSWSGSVGGVQTVVNNLNVSTWLAATNLTSGGVASLTGPYEAAVTADACMSDSFQGSTAYTSPTLTDHVVGVVPFQWVRNVGSPSTMANISTLFAHILLGTGQVPLSEMTGLNADESVLVTALGRDEDSGTRLDAFAESGFGIFGAPFQYQPTIAGGVVTAVAPWPVNTVNGTTYPVGHSGYSSGGTLATAMGATGSLAASGGWFVTYLSTGDAASAVALGAATMTYNGVAYSLAAVQEGQYTFWSYEHLMYRSSLAGSQKTVADQIATKIHDADAAVLLGGMQVGRTVEGGDVTFGSPY